MAVGLLRKYGLGSDIRAVDIACGCGGNFQVFDPFKPKLVAGIELSPIALGYARRKAPEALLVRADLNADAPFSDESFDVATVFNAFYHEWVKDDRAMLGESAIASPRRSSCPHGACLRGATPRDGSGRHGTATLYAARYPGAGRERGTRIRLRQLFPSFVYPIALGMGIADRVRSRRPAAAMVAEQLDLNALGERMNESLYRLAAWEADCNRARPKGALWRDIGCGAAAERRRASFPVNARLPVRLAALACRSRLAADTGGGARFPWRAAACALDLLAFADTLLRADRRAARGRPGLGGRGSKVDVRRAGRRHGNLYGTIEIASFHHRRRASLRDHLAICPDRASSFARHGKLHAAGAEIVSGGTSFIGGELAYYASRWFADLPDACVLSKKSTNYLESPVAAQQIRESLPQVKLIFVLRNPVDRAWSNYRWSRQNGYERLEFAEALALEESREHSLPRELKYARPHAYFSRGLYFDMLAPYFRLFPRKQILILRCEDGLVDPAGLAVKFHHFLGVEPRPDDAIGLGLANSAAEQCALDGHIRGELSKRYAESNRRLASLLGRDFCTW